VFLTSFPVDTLRDAPTAPPVWNSFPNVERRL
jgi:hypothetical protein